MNILMKRFIIVIIFSTTIAFLGCEKKVETQDVKPDITTKSDSVQVEETMVDTTTPVVEIPVVQIPDLKGKWTGKFDSRMAVLEITEQTDSSFFGKISIAYREPVNQEVSGTVSPSKMKISMKDLIRSRYKGKYYGNLSKDGKTYSGTFTMDVDKTKLAFNLTKK